MEDNKLTGLPSEFGRLKNLEYLSFDSNKIAILPDSFGDLEKLRYLSLISNPLRTFPLSITKLHNLHHLILSCSKIRSIPPEIGNLFDLRHFTLINCKICSFPRELSQLVNLEVFMCLPRIDADDVLPHIKNIRSIVYLSSREFLNNDNFMENIKPVLTLHCLKPNPNKLGYINIVPQQQRRRRCVTLLGIEAMELF
ncbi:leucine-rich repeat domain-containing protein, partial [Candidatus Saccharibacteria bacterium]|nr:leucine-rich repeat domain-containing protein [Candidatus Saccharibacteria bacterium]